jgi:hypothetical protein
VEHALTPSFAGHVESLVEYAVRHQDAAREPPDWAIDESDAVGLLFAHVADVSPAWHRLNEMVKDRLGDLHHPRFERRAGKGSLSHSAATTKSAW